MTSISDILSRPAEEFENDPTVEAFWAYKAAGQIRIHFNLITSVPPRDLKLTKKDDMIYSKFRETFPDLKVDLVNEEDLKSAESKAKWRPFCELFKDEVEDYNFASLIRIDCSKDYSDENAILVPRIQFLALEIARNREGYNDFVYHAFKNKTETDENV